MYGELDFLKAKVVNGQKIRPRESKRSGTHVTEVSKNFKFFIQLA